MSEQPWERMSNEPALWYRRFERFRLMDPVRSVAAVFQEEEAAKNSEKPRTKPTGDWYKLAAKWHWDERASAWDAYQDAQIDARILAEEKKVVKQAYALKYKRIEELNRIVTKLIGYLEDEDNIWLPDVKAIGSGEFAERVDLVRFNAPIFAEIRAHLDDIAKEKGERVKQSKLALTFPPDTYGGIGPDDDGSMP